MTVNPGDRCVPEEADSAEAWGMTTAQTMVTFGADPLVEVVADSVAEMSVLRSSCSSKSSLATAIS